MIVDRTQAPAYQAIHDIRLPAVETHTLDNGQPLYVISVDQQPVLRLECNFEAGSWYETQPNTSFFALKMLAEGTASRSSADISEYFDRYGAFLELNSGHDRASLVVYCLTKHLPAILPMVREMLTEPTFPEKEFNDLRNITVQNLRVNLEKNSYLAGVLFREQVFGSTHPYGRSQELTDIEGLAIEPVIYFYKRTIRHRPFRILLAGQAGIPEISLVNEILGQLPIEPAGTPAVLVSAGDSLNQSTFLDKPASVQSSIRLGRKLFTRQHPDYYNMLVTNEVLGGYFGSRLMKNIREEKGLTYGIWSSVAAFRHEGYFLIGTDVKKEFTQLTLDEIWKEIRMLATEPVPADELETVKNYMAGEFVGSLNTPFEIADRFKIVLYDNLPADFLNHHIANLRAVTPTNIQETVNRYLLAENLIEVVVGGKQNSTN
ncbi:pitrilysin family protein [Nibrella saemangeumensis]|uniref:Pitrilysin family protein n=1 Tax=Nibrella saemangeumensis TaxID=1084526 RepID=A0ABP8NDA3_9BACT